MIRQRVLHRKEGLDIARWGLALAVAHPPGARDFREPGRILRESISGTSLPAADSDIGLVSSMRLACTFDSSSDSPDADDSSKWESTGAWLSPEASKTGTERISVMLRLRNALIAAAMGTGMAGCALSNTNVAHYSIWHCDECDDFPSPAYGPDFSLMPGTYTGRTAQDSATANQPPSTTPDFGAGPPPQQPVGTPPPTGATPPIPPAASPADGLQGTGRNQ